MEPKSTLKYQRWLKSLSPEMREKHRENQRECCIVWYYRNREKRLEKIECEYCCRMVARQNMNKHLNTKVCKYVREQLEKDLKNEM